MYIKRFNVAVPISPFLFQCVQKLSQPLHPPVCMESVDPKDTKLQEQDQKQLVQTEDSSARRAKRMKYEVGVVQAAW